MFPNICTLGHLEDLLTSELRLFSIFWRPHKQQKAGSKMQYSLVCWQ